MLLNDRLLKLDIKDWVLQTVDSGLIVKVIFAEMIHWLVRYLAFTVFNITHSILYYVNCHR